MSRDGKDMNLNGRNRSEHQFLLPNHIAFLHGAS